MPPVPPKKPAPKKKIARGIHTRPIEQETAGKIYLVRDKDYGDGQPVMWARDVPYEQAFKLKETVAARKLSTTVRFEEQTADNAAYLELPIDPRSPWQPVSPIAKLAQDALRSLTPDPVKPAAPSVPFSLDAARGAALGAAGGAAAEANRRHAELTARKEAEAKVAAMEPLPMPELPTEEEMANMSDEELAKLGIDPDELAAIMSGEISEDELAAAAAEVAEKGTLNGQPFNALEQSMHWPCTHEGCGAMPGIACKDPSGPITHQERIQAALAAGAPAATDPQSEVGHG